MLITVSGVAVDLLMDALTDIIHGVMHGVMINIDVDVLVEVTINVFAGIMTAFELGPLEEFRCWAAFDCRPMTALD